MSVGRHNLCAYKNLHRLNNEIPYVNGIQTPPSRILVNDRDQWVLDAFRSLISDGQFEPYEECDLSNFQAAATESPSPTCCRTEGNCIDLSVDCHDECPSFTAGYEWHASLLLFLCKKKINSLFLILRISAFMLSIATILRYEMIASQCWLVHHRMPFPRMVWVVLTL
jgi:hypothetical protein